MQICFKILVISAVFGSFYSCHRVAKNSNSKKPNILVLISDDQRWDQLSYADNPLIPQLKTPNMDKLARQGVYFNNAFVTTPICSVSRASIMTGKYSCTHGMNHFNTSITKEVLSKSYPALLHASGYKTGILGKWGMGIDGIA
ncbi:Bifunctional sulfatase/alpha-L-rhamnosidase [subsurface metagenome]